MSAAGATRVFPILHPLHRSVGGEGSIYSEHLKGARFTIPTPALLG